MVFQAPSRDRKSVSESTILCKKTVHKFGNHWAAETKEFSYCYEFKEYMVPNKTSGKYSRTENVWEGNCLIEILRRTVGETKQFVRILMYDLPLYLEKNIMEKEQPKNTVDGVEERVD